MKKNIKTKTHNLYKIIFILVVFLGIGYAFLEANLNINGGVTVEAPELNSYIQGVNVTSGSTTGTPTIIGNDKKEVDFTTALTSDGSSFFEETTTVINKGSKKAYLSGIDIKVYNGTTEITLAAPYEYSITHGDGTAIETGEELAIAGTQTYKFKFNYISGTDMTTVTDYPSYTFKITYNYTDSYTPPVCNNNENITTLSSTTCSANENVTVPAGTICKRAIQLHQEECTQTDYYCSGAGYTASGSKGTTTITYGNCGTQQADPVSGDAFTCDVNGDGTFDELTERFYYVSDYYDTTNKVFDTTTAVLVYYNNVTEGVSCNKNTYAYYGAASVNRRGPETVKLQLPTTTQWSNVSLKNNSRAILAEYTSTHDSPTTEGGTLPRAYSYSGYAARFLTVKELMSGCGLSQVGSCSMGELDTCNYLMENTKYAKSSIGSYGYWLESPHASHSSDVWNVVGGSRDVGSYYANDSSSRGARPVIEVPKNKISY